MDDRGTHLLGHVHEAELQRLRDSEAGGGLRAARHGRGPLRPRRSRSKYPPPPAATRRMATTAISIGRRLMYVLYQGAPVRTLGATG